MGSYLLIEKKTRALEVSKSGVATASASTSKKHVDAFVQWLQNTYDIQVVQAVKHNWEGHHATALDVYQGKAKEQGQWLPHWHIHLEIEMIERSTGRSVNSRGMRYTRALEKECWKAHETTLKALESTKRKAFIKQWKQDHAKRYPRSYFGIGRSLNFATISKKWADIAGLERGIEGSQAKHIPINQFIKNQTLQAELFEQYGNIKTLLANKTKALHQVQGQLERYTPEKLQEVKEAFERQSIVACGQAYGFIDSEVEAIQKEVRQQDSEQGDAIDVFEEIKRRGTVKIKSEVDQEKTNYQSAQEEAWKTQLVHRLYDLLNMQAVHRKRGQEGLEHALALYEKQLTNHTEKQALDTLANQIYEIAGVTIKTHWKQKDGTVIAMIPQERLKNALKYATAKYHALKHQVNKASVRQEVKEDIQREEDQTYRIQVRKSQDQQMKNQEHDITNNQSVIKKQKDTITQKKNEIKALDREKIEKQKTIDDLSDKREEYTHLVKEIDALKVSPPRIHTAIWREGLILRIENLLDRDKQRVIEKKQKALPAWEIEEIMQPQGWQREPSLGIGF